MSKIRLSRADLMSAGLCVFLIIPGVSIYDKLPDRMATNFNLNGQPQQYASKEVAVFGFPILLTVLQLVLCIITNLFHQTDTRDRINQAVRFIFPAISYFAQFSILLYALGQMKDIVMMACTLMSILFVVIGNYMPKIRRNMFFGVRTPHTLMNQELWDKSNRFSGALLIICGLLMLPFSLMGNYVAVIIIIAVKTIAPYIYSEVLYLSEKKKVHE